MQRYFLLFSLLLSGFVAGAQGIPGFVLTLPGDTLRGIVREGSDGTITFYPAGAGPGQLYRADQLRGYAAGRHPAMRSRAVRSARGLALRQFVAPQFPGPASLYSYANGTGFLLQPAASDTLYELTAYNWHLLFNRHLRACPTLRHTDQRMLDLAFTEDNLLKVLTQYNRCVDAAWRPRRATRLSAWRQGLAGQLGLLGWAGGSRFEAQGGIGWTFLRANGVQVTPQLLYSQYREETTQADAGNPLLETREQLRLGLLEAGLVVGKRFGHPQRPSWFMGGGGGLGYPLSFRLTTQRSTGGVSVTESVSETPDGILLHAEVSTGVIFPLTAHGEIRVNALYKAYALNHVGSLGAQVVFTGFW